MEKATVVALCLCLLLAAAGRQDAGAVEFMTIPKNMISCKALGNCDKDQGGDATRPGKPANTYTRGCSRIDRCRD